MSLNLKFSTLSVLYSAAFVLLATSSSEMPSTMQQTTKRQLPSSQDIRKLESQLLEALRSINKRQMASDLSSGNSGGGGGGGRHQFVDRESADWSQAYIGDDSSANDFDKIIDRILQLAGLEDLQQQPTTVLQQANVNSNNNNNKENNAALKVHADANNKTTMRFFRNNKTFASIVYTNHDKNNNNNNNNNEVHQPRRLINCHLVDLERHSPDVALFESKYEIKTIDIEFKEMMQLIEQCTNIARFKTFGASGHPIPSPLLSANQQLKHSGLRPNVAQLFAASLPDRNSYAATGSAGHKHHQSNTYTAFRPFLIVNKPSSSAVAATNPGFLTPASSKTVAQFPLLSYAPGPTPATNPVTSQSQTPVSTFQSVMTGALDHELKKLPSVVDDSNKLDLPNHSNQQQQQQLNQQQQHQQHHSRRAVQRRSYQMSSSNMPHFRFGFHENDHRNSNGLQTSRSVAATLIQKATKKLVLGEVTPAPNLVDGRQGGIKEALQEITNYDTTDLLSIWRGILPGTNWCGMGDRATSYNDLGFESDIDICCRAHDFCPIRLSAFSGGYGLFNWSFYTRSHCWCDQNFLDCLQRAQSPLSSVVMKFYFTIMKTTCLHDNETTLAYADPAAPMNLAAAAASGTSNFQQHQPQMHLFQDTNVNKQRGGGSTFLDNNNELFQLPTLPAIMMTNEHANTGNRFPIMQHNNAAQQKLLLEQIKATMPIPALKQSQVVQSRVETPPMLMMNATKQFI